jgi:hypothetical protein
MRQRIVGKRGGISMGTVTCVTCVAWPGCSSASALNLKFGCAAWVDFETGARIAPDAAADLPVEVAEATMEPDDEIEYTKEEPHE